MDNLFPGTKKFTIRNEKGEITDQWQMPALDWKAKVVCEPCNNGWMSDIESQHAEPALRDLILGKLDIPITQSRARSIALFAFKSAVVFNHMRTAGEPFFPQSVRQGFRDTLTIPDSVNMWMAGFLPIGKGEVHACYHDGAVGGHSIKLYVCTYAVGHFVFQVLAVNQDGLRSIASRRQGFEQVAVRFWPTLPADLQWPLADVLRTVGDFDRYSTRWQDVMVRF